ncbi:MAG: acetylxylan esterase [Bryobacterales bacterium]|nr:acetylxylan esterase [Bryobacterales bacterium]
MLPLLLLVALTAPAFPQQLPATDRRNTDLPGTDTHFQPHPYKTLAEWQTRAAHLRNQVRSAAGLLPEPPKTPLNAQIFGRIEHKDYSIEKVYIETLPGFFLAGNLYRPVGRPGRHPGVLAPHGHAQYGRLEHGPLFSVPARGINMARQGYVVFGYDMVGYNDTIQFPHVWGSNRELLYSFGPLALQTWNSIRALDFLESLPDVDPTRLSVTGESGGGTQTFLLTAIDPRPKVSSPVNMISAIMQGGSPCENQANLRIGTYNVEIAALMAPRPMLMVAATGDWTKNTPREEYPTMKAIYALYDKAANVETVQFDAPHNYHKESREAVYRFFAKHLLQDPNADTYTEKNIAAEKLQDLMVFHNRALPPNARTQAQIIEDWISMAKRQNQETKDPNEFRHRLAIVIGAELPTAKVLSQPAPNQRLYLGRPEAGDRIPAIWLPKPNATTATLVIHPEGAEKARTSPEAQKAINAGHSVLAIDAFQTGTAVAPRNTNARHFLAFNRTEDAHRVQDILTALAFLKQSGAQTLNLTATGNAAIWSRFAAALSPMPVTLNAPTPAHFTGTDEDFLKHFFIPGIQRAGGWPAALLLTK